VFYTPAEGGDTISDYSNAVGNNDVIQIYAAGFGAGLTAGALAPGQFRARFDGLAQDANDRFIFNKTTKALWFDANGDAAGGSLLVADLQAGAVVTAGDIVLV
jgi:Ca2+-binding RTX toxin-like protein